MIELTNEELAKAIAQLANEYIRTLEGERIEPVAWLVEHRAKGRDTPWLHYALMKDKTRAEGLAGLQDPIVEYRMIALNRETVTMKVIKGAYICPECRASNFNAGVCVACGHDGVILKPQEPVK